MRWRWRMRPAAARPVPIRCFRTRTADLAVPSCGGRPVTVPDDYDRRGPRLSDDAGYADIMGACFPKAIAPYHFKKAFDWMVWGLDAWEREIFGEANSGPSLALSGHIDDSGVPVVTSARVSPMPPHAQTGPFSVAVLDEAGFAVGESAFRGRANYRRREPAQRSVERPGACARVDWRRPDHGRGRRAAVNSAPERTVRDRSLMPHLSTGEPAESKGGF